jgi:hypothetical protein
LEKFCVPSTVTRERLKYAGDDKHCYGLLMEIKFHDKNSSLDESMRYNALYRDKIKVTHERTLEDLILGTNDGDRGSHG